METIKDYIIRVLKKDGLPECIINDVLQLSEERIQWLKDVAWNLARITGKYDRLAITKELSILEKLILIKIETEETKKWNDELKIKHEEEMRKHEEFLRKTDEFLRQLQKRKASASLNYIFPIGEA